MHPARWRSSFQTKLCTGTLKCSFEIYGLRFSASMTAALPSLAWIGSHKCVGQCRIYAARGGTQAKKKEEDGKSGRKVSGERPPVKLLSRIEQLRLLSKLEKSGLLSAAENLGFSLSSLEKQGLLSKAETFGVLSAVTDPNTPGYLIRISIVLFALGPVAVYLIPEDSTLQVAVQTVLAILSVLGGSAAFAASRFVSILQEVD